MLLVSAVVEDCVNAVGVDVNTASAPLLARISGLSSSLAENIVTHRDTNGPFKSRDQLKTVSRLGPKTFEQCAGFLRIKGSENPLDASAVHPESYSVVEAMAAGVPVVATDIEGYRQVATDDLDALLVTPGDAGALASAIGRVIDDDNLAWRLAAAGRERAATFDWGVVVDRIEGVYRSVLDGPSLR